MAKIKKKNLPFDETVKIAAEKTGLAKKDLNAYLGATTDAYRQLIVENAPGIGEELHAPTPFGKTVVRRFEKGDVLNPSTGAKADCTLYGVSSRPHKKTVDMLNVNIKKTAKTKTA